MKKQTSTALLSPLLAALCLLPACQSAAPSAPPAEKETEVTLSEAPAETEKAVAPAPVPTTGPRVIVDGKTRTHTLTAEEKEK